MSDPLVSVIIPTYSRADSVGKAVESVLGQTYSRLECIVIDDMSADDSTQILQEKFGNNIKLISQSHSGVSAARNLGVRESRGCWIAFLDSDDVWNKDKLDQQISFHQKIPEMRISQTQEIWIRHGKQVSAKKKHKKPSGYIFPQSLEMCLISPSSVILEKELFVASGGFDEDLLVCEDYDLWLRLTIKNRVGLLDQLLLTKYGGHSDQLSHQYEAIDRFRIYSLLKLLLSEELTDLQRSQTVSEAEKKLNILKLGANKRGVDFSQTELLGSDVFMKKISLKQFLRRGKDLLLNDDLFVSH